MVQLNIQVDLLPEKLNEFLQSWESFAQHAINCTMLVSHTMKLTGDNAYEIKLTCKGKKQLQQLKTDGWFEFLIGAIETLGDKSHTREINIQ